MVVAGHTFGLLAALLYVCLLVVIYVCVTAGRCSGIWPDGKPA